MEMIILLLLMLFVQIVLQVAILVMVSDFINYRAYDNEQDENDEADWWKTKE